MAECDRLHCNDTIGRCPGCPAKLREAEAAYQAAFRHSETLRLERNALVRQALEAGWTHARIAEATGLTRGRIGQLAQKDLDLPLDNA